jgi:hypothetical protein
MNDDDGRCRERALGAQQCSSDVNVSGGVDYRALLNRVALR